MRYSEIVSVGGYAPSKVVDNNELANIVDTSDEWIVSRTGISKRRISEGENTSHLCAKAAQKALERANISATEIDLIIVATCTPDTLVPSVACLVQDSIGAYNASAFDINAACSGFIYGLKMADSLIKTGAHNKALVIGGEVLSKALDWEDRSTLVLFGDGAGCALIQASEEEKVKYISTGAEADKWSSLTLGGLEVKNPFVKEPLNKIPQKIEMSGGEVFKFATRVIPEEIKKLIEKTGISLDEVKYIVPHQANIRIIQYAAKKLNVDINKFYINIDEYANTSAGTIPLALNDMYEKSLIKKGDYIILVGFGGGLTYGSALIKF